MITSYKDEAADLITKHGKDAVNAMKRGIDPTLIKTLDDLGIDPSHYDELGIVGRESAEAVADVLGRKTLRVIDAIADSSIVNRVKEIRGFLPSDLKRGGNFGLAKVEVSGLKNEFYAHNGINVVEDARSAATSVADISIKPTNPIFEATSEMTNSGTPLLRDVDSEYKILNDVASKLGNNVDTTGKITLFTERAPCPSCDNVILEFLKKYKNIKIDVIHSNGEILKP